MDSYKPFSTIGYNTEEFLRKRLDEFRYQYPDSFWCYIYHRDETGKKDHYHLYIEPNVRLRQSDFLLLRKSFEELCDDNDKPLACMPFQKSKFKDWYLYGKHDSDYLNSKHLQKSTYDYSDDLFVSSDNEIFNQNIMDCDPTEYMCAFDKMKFCKDNGMTIFEAMSYLRIPYSGMYGFMKIWEIMDKPQKYK